jgi:hypothetical protein
MKKRREFCNPAEETCKWFLKVSLWIVLARLANFFDII